jgi:hypothetical protein
MQNQNENKNASTEAMRADEKSASPNMKIDAIVQLYNATSQRIFGKLSTCINLKIENAQVLAQLTEGDAYFTNSTQITLSNLIGGHNDHEIARFLEDQALNKATKEKSLTITLDLANLEGFQELIAELHKKDLTEKHKKDLTENAEREWNEAQAKKKAELQQIPGVAVCYQTGVNFQGKRIMDPTRENFLKLTPEKLFGEILSEQKANAEKEEKRIANLEKHLRALIKVSDADTLIKAGLADAPQPEDNQEEEEQLPERQEALERTGLDC